MDFKRTTDSRHQYERRPKPFSFGNGGCCGRRNNTSKIERKFENTAKVLPIIVHGDAAIAEGLALKSFKWHAGMAQGYHSYSCKQSNWIYHNYLDARSSTYCTDVGKVTLSPVLHVNADDVEAVVHATFLLWTSECNLGATSLLTC